MLVLISNPLSGEIEAVAEPLVILNASCDRAFNGILNKPSPEPVNAEAETVVWKYADTFVLKPSIGDTEADAEPDTICVESIAKLASVIFLNFEPSPTKNEPVSAYILPFTLKLPVNCEPLVIDSTLNPN